MKRLFNPKYSVGMNENQFRTLRVIAREGCKKTFVHPSRLRMFTNNGWCEVVDNTVRITAAGLKVYQIAAQERLIVDSKFQELTGCPPIDTPERLVWLLNGAYGVKWVSLSTGEE